MTTIFSAVQRNLRGEAVGVASYCTAHGETIRAVCEAAASGTGPVLLEATCNQVNQEGGYTGLQPDGYRRMVEAIAVQAGLAPERLVLGGDHLGPNPWRSLPANDAMDRACAMVAAYAAAGYRKLHLDASMRLGGDPAVLPEALVAQRAALLCQAAETTAPGIPIYVIGTEVPVPGGETSASAEIRPTAPASLAETVAQHRAAFASAGLLSAFNRVVAVVAQPGVDFSNEVVLPFDPAAVNPLAKAVAGLNGIAAEAHSTDYQPLAVLQTLVRSHFAILKVGPELTAAYRRAMLALAHIETVLIPTDRQSGLVEVLLRRMAERPADWSGYYTGDAQTVRRMQLFSFSDRIRYYWPDPVVNGAVSRLLANLDGNSIPPLLFEQYCPDLRPPGQGESIASVARQAVARTVSRYRDVTG